MKVVVFSSLFIIFVLAGYDLPPVTLPPIPQLPPLTPGFLNSPHGRVEDPPFSFPPGNNLGPIPPLPGDWKIDDTDIEDITNKFSKNLTDDDIQHIRDTVQDFVGQLKDDIEGSLENATQCWSDAQNKANDAYQGYSDAHQQYVSHKEDTDAAINVLLDLAVGSQNDAYLLTLAVLKNKQQRIAAAASCLNISAQALQLQLLVLDAKVKQLKVDIYQNRLQCKNAGDNGTAIALLNKTFHDRLDDLSDALQSIESKNQAIATLLGSADQDEGNDTDISTVLENIAKNKFRTIAEAKAAVLEKPDWFAHHVADDLRNIHDCIRNVSVVIHNVDSDLKTGFSFVCTVSVDCGNDTDIDLQKARLQIEALLKGVAVVNLQLPVDNIIINKIDGSKRSGEDDSWSVEVDQSDTNENIEQIFAKVTLNFTVPDVDNSTLTGLIERLTDEVSALKVVVESLTLEQLQELVVVLQGQLQAAASDANSTVRDLKRLADSFSEYINSKYQDSEDDTLKKAADIHTSEADVVNAIYQSTIQRLNNTKRAIELIRQQYDIQLKVALTIKIQTQLDYVNLLISIKTASALDLPALLAKKLILQGYLFEAWKKLVVLNQTIEYIAQEVSDWEDNLVKQVQDAAEKVHDAASKIWKTVQEVKAEWKQAKDSIRQTIRNYIEQFIANATVVNDDFDDVDNTTKTVLHLSWQLDVQFDPNENHTAKILQIEAVITNILVTTAGVSKDFVTVKVQFSNKRAGSSLSANANVDSGSSSSTSSSTSGDSTMNNTYYIIGGVVGGVVFIAIVVIIVILIIKKKNNERV